MEVRSVPIKIIRSHEELRNYKDGWNSLVLNSPQKSPMSSWCWISTHLELRLKDNEDWFCVVAGEPNRVLGVLPVVVSPKKILWMTFPALRTPGDYHTFGVDMVVDEINENIVIPLLIDAALKEYPSCCYLELSQIAEHSPTVRWLRNNKQKISLNIIEECVGKSAYVFTGTSFEELRRSFSKNLRSVLNKQRRNLNKITALEFENFSGERANQSELYRMATVEDKNWKGTGGSSILSSKSLFKFYLVLCERLAKEEWLEWNFLNTADSTIAASMAIRIDDSIVLWKIGYDEKFKKYSPGNLLLEDVIRSACNLNILSTVELVSDLTWHNQWNVKKRNIVRYKLIPNKLVNYFIVFFAEKIKISAKNSSWVKKLYLTFTNR